MASLHLSVPDLQHNDGTFSFVTSRLHANITHALPTYDKTDPKTWPAIRTSPQASHTSEKVMERYQTMYSAEERAFSTPMNGSFHKRYPLNYNRFEMPKEDISMSLVEYQSYIGHATIVLEDWEDATFAPDDSTPYPSPKTPSRNHGERESLCGNKKCAEDRRDLARLRGALFDKESQLLTFQKHLTEYETTELLRRNTLADAEFHLDKEKRRAEAAEKDCMLRIEAHILLLKRVRDLEMRVAEVEDLETYCAELEGEIKTLKGKGAKKRARDKAESDGEMKDAIRTGKKIILEDSG